MSYNPPLLEINTSPTPFLEGSNRNNPSNNSNKYIQENNSKALELLLRIQSQLEASRVIATSTARESNYE